MADVYIYKTQMRHCVFSNAELENVRFNIYNCYGLIF